MKIKKYQWTMVIIVVIHFWIILGYFLYQNPEYIIPGYDNLADIPIKHDTERLTLTYRSEAITLEPTTFDNRTKVCLSHIYDPLVQFDANLKLIPALALSWGKISDTLYEFKLRPNVKFHNGDTLDSQDVLASFERALTLSGSQMRPLLANIETMTAPDQETIHIQLKTTDPLLTSNLSHLYILPTKIAQDPNHDWDLDPVGTGPYQMKRWKKGQFMELTAFNDYYRKKPVYQTLFLKVVPNKYARMATVRDHSTDILLNVPPSFVNNASQRFKYKVEVIPSLEAMFLLFNLHNEFLAQKELREAIKYGLKYQDIIDLGEGYANNLNQFASSGVLGYNPKIAEKNQDLVQASYKISQADIPSTPLLLALSKENYKLGQILKTQFEELQIPVEIKLLEPDEVLEDLATGNSDIYLIGWRYNNGDIDEFYKYVVHSRVDESGLGQFNGLAYHNPQVDDIIGQASAELDLKRRLKLLQQIMQTITEEDVIGVPLFETDQIYAIRPGINFTPRIDGLVSML